MSVTMEKFTRTNVRTDDELQKAVLAELHWDTHIKDAPAIGVSVHKGVVTLSGQVPTFAQKMAAQKAALRVMGVQDVANDIIVVYPGHLKKTDAEIAQAVRSALEWDTLVPEQNIQSTVADGWVTLTGTVTNWWESWDTEKAIRNLSGIRGMTNNILVASSEPDPDASLIRKAIEEALERQTEREVKHLGITVKQGTVTLTGTVRSSMEKLAATGAAGYAPGVRHVENYLKVDPSQ